MTWLLAVLAVSRIIDTMIGVTTDREQLTNAVRKELSRLVLRGRLPKSVTEISDEVIRTVLDMHPGIDGTSEDALDNDLALPTSKKPTRRRKK